MPLGEQTRVGVRPAVESLAVPHGGENERRTLAGEHVPHDAVDTMEVLEHRLLAILGTAADAVEDRAGPRSAAVGNEGMNLSLPWPGHRQLGPQSAVQGDLVKPETGALEQPDVVGVERQHEEVSMCCEHREKGSDQEAASDRGEFGQW